MSINAKQSLKGNLNVGAGSEVEIYSYYTPSVTQPDTNTMQVDYTPSSEDMPAIDPVQIVLPVGPKGEPGDDGYTPQKGIDYFDGVPGEDGKDGITPHIGENGNWFIGDEDTGTSAAGGNYTLPTASTDILGGVKADPVTDSDTQPVHIDETGKLFTTPGSNFVAQPEPPDDKNVLWIDTDDDEEDDSSDSSQNANKPLNFTGAVSATYDGTKEVTVNIPSGGSGSSGGGLSSTEKNAILTILDGVIVETSKQEAISQAIATLKQFWSGGEVFVSQVGTTLALENVTAITTITQNGTTLALA